MKATFKAQKISFAGFTPRRNLAINLTNPPSTGAIFHNRPKKSPNGKAHALGAIKSLYFWPQNGQMEYEGSPSLKTTLGTIW